jgi:hypothetical protein
MNKTTILEKRLTEMFNYQATTYKPIDDEAVAGHMEAMIKNVRGHSNFTVNVGDTVYKYFIQDANGDYFLKYGTNLISMINDIIIKRDITYMHENLGIPVIRI